MTSATEKQCKYCDGSKNSIETEVDGDAYIKITPDDSEYPEGFLLDVYSNVVSVRGNPLWYSFIVPCCPMCGRRLKADDD